VGIRGLFHNIGVFECPEHEGNVSEAEQKTHDAEAEGEVIAFVGVYEEKVGAKNYGEENAESCKELFVIQKVCFIFPVPFTLGFH
jgi:hypothetical protein